MASIASIDGGYVSADGHFVEPATLWTERMDKRSFATGRRASRLVTMRIGISLTG